MRKTNYELMSFLVKNGGYYNASGHLEVLQQKFPKAGIDKNQITELRHSIRTSKLVVYDAKTIHKMNMHIKVISVHPRFANLSRLIDKKKMREKITDSYFTCGHQTEIRAIKLRRQFDQLLSGCRGLSQR